MEKQTETTRKWLARRGVSVRKLNYILLGIALVISALLLVATYQTRGGYEEMRSYTEDYIQCQADAYEMQIASDYLSEQVRCFVETGERQYLSAYFEEADVRQRREKALQHVKDYLGEDSEAYQALQAAMLQSRLLMDREYYAMRLMVEAEGYPLVDFPSAIVNVALRSGDQAMAPEVQRDLARSMVFDQVYRERKAAIIADMDTCLAKLSQAVKGRQVETTENLERLLNNQQIMIILLIVVAIGTLLTTLLMVIHPLLKAVDFIREEQPIPVRGSNEFRFLARTYNLIFEAGREKKEKLAYEATHDKLTGAYNRSGYIFLMENAELESSALLIVDVDKFKSTNDTYGHTAGDKALMKVAESLRSSFRSQDYVCRIGGDEFVVIMVKAKSASEEMVVNKINSINEILKNPTEKGLPPTSISCGVAFGSAGIDGDQLFRIADAALYEVKGNGGCGCLVGH